MALENQLQGVLGGGDVRVYFRVNTSSGRVVKVISESRVSGVLSMGINQRGINRFNGAERVDGVRQFNSNFDPDDFDDLSMSWKRN